MGKIDVQACTKKGIRVSNVPTAVDDATADTNSKKPSLPASMELRLYKVVIPTQLLFLCPIPVTL